MTANKNLFSAQGTTENSLIISTQKKEEKFCKKCEQLKPIEEFIVSKKHVKKSGEISFYRDSYCGSCRSKLNSTAPFRKKEKYTNYQKNFQKNYQRKT